jgi:anaerobic selenocysteine-containing dehydrogenase
MVKKRGTCSKDCYGACVFIGEWDNQIIERKFLRAIPLKNHPFTNGFFCKKLSRREELAYHPMRLRKALIRTGKKGANRFNEIPLNEAIRLIGKKIKCSTEDYGGSSILAAFNSGNSGLVSRFGPLRFFGKLGAEITTGGICNEGGCVGLSKLFGTYSITNPFQLINIKNRLIVNWGSDVANHNIHTYNLIKKAIKHGTNLISIDSRRTPIFNDSDLTILIPPGMDHLFAQVILKGILEEEAYDKGFLVNHTNNFEEIISEIEKVDIKEVLSKLKLEYSEIESIIQKIIENKHHTIFNIGYGVQKDYYGGRIIQIIVLIQILLGNLGKPGTGIIYSQSDFNKPFLTPLIDYITQKAFYTPFKENIKLINLGQELNKEKHKILFIYNFNPASSLPNQNQLRKSLLREDLFTVVQEIFLTETTKYADIVIPSKFDIESDDLIASYYIPGISINQAGPCPYEDCLTNYEFYQKLAFEMKWFNFDFNKENDLDIVKNCLNLLPMKIKENLNAQGFHLLFDKEDIPYKNLNFPTKNNLIQLNNISFEFSNEDLNRKFRRRLNEFLLITPPPSDYLHSQLGHIEENLLNIFEKIYLNQIDIEKLDLKIGKAVSVYNNLGNALYIVEKSEIIKPGLAIIYSGSPMAKHPNPNLFTSDIPEEIGFSGAYNSALVRVKKVS